MQHIDIRMEVWESVLFFPLRFMKELLESYRKEVKLGCKTPKGVNVANVSTHDITGHASNYSIEALNFLFAFVSSSIN